MKRLRTFLERLPGGHRPPTGPLTTAETTDAEESRQETLAKDNERIEREQEEASDRRDPRRIAHVTFRRWRLWAG